MDQPHLISGKMREFPMSAENFKTIKSLAYQLTGIHLSDHKENMIYGRLARRVRALDLQTFDEYCAYLQEDDSPELGEFINAITTNLTAFFREPHHFDFLRDQVLPELLEKNKATRKIRIWSAGCSTGEEPHSIAMVVKSCSALANWDVKILATDLDTNVLDKGRSGLYSAERGDSVPAAYRQFMKLDKPSEQIKIKDEVRNLITFNQLNLLQDWPMKGLFDVIFCRNVVIYFDAPTQKKLFDRYAQHSADKAYLFIGHSENLHKICDRYQGLGRTIYQKCR
jgi:chemotaxis protein methyltransferase CheR